MQSNPKWLEWVQRLQSLAQSGLTYSQNPFDIERFQQIREIAAEIASSYSEIDLPVIRTILEDQAGYATPKVDSRGVVFQDGKILLVKEIADGAWTLPGGWVDVNEAPSFAVEREVWEESGFQVRAVKLLALFDRNQHGHPAHLFHIYKLFFRCQLIGGSAADSIETNSAAFFAQEQIPPLSIQRTTMEEINRMFDHFRNPDLPTDFD